MVYKISQATSIDIKNIWLYTLENWSIQQADRYFNLIIDEIEFIAQNPQSGLDYGQVRKGYFRSKIKSHFIFYKINQAKNQVEIIRILHQRMDVDSRLDE